MKNEVEFKYPLGARVKDKVTGYTGIIIAQTRWMYGCLRYSVQAQEMKDGKPVDSLCFDEGSLDLLDSPLKNPKVPPGGGPTPEVSRGRTVTR